LQPRVIELDAKYIPLADAVENNKSDIHAQLALANFLLAQHNDREAIPHLTAIADSKTADPKLRIDAWVNMARAHLWIVEPEKARHESQALIATLGPVSPLAIAGGNLVHGLQDATAKRFALARKEFKASVAAAPDSDYAKQAAAALAQLPKEGR
jgi:phosphopantothenoylcysteine synthetase/decarboxylase